MGLKIKWSERQDLNLRRLAPKASALARLSYAPTWAANIYGMAVFRNVFRPAFSWTLAGAMLNCSYVNHSACRASENQPAPARYHGSRASAGAFPLPQ